MTIITTTLSIPIIDSRKKNFIFDTACSGKVLLNTNTHSPPPPSLSLSLVHILFLYLLFTISLSLTCILVVTYTNIHANMFEWGDNPDGWVTYTFR